MKTTKKTLKKEQIEEIFNFIKNKGFLEKKEFEYFKKKFNYCISTFERELFINKIPYKSGNLIKILLSFEINVCKKCILLNDFLKLGTWRNELFKNSKIKANFQCSECGKSGVSVLGKLLKRKFFKGDPICSNCIGKKVTNTEEWKKTNSDAQFIAQNKEDVKEKNRNIQLERFKDPELIKKYSETTKKLWETKEYREKIEEANRERWKDPEYARRVLENSKNGGLKGIYKNIHYDSGYELAYLMMMDDKGELSKIKRTYIYIEYISTKNKKAKYFPDFIYDKNYVVEVKGYAPWTDIENTYLKNKAGSIWCKENNMKFRLIELKDFGYHWYKKAILMHRKLENDKNKEQENNSL